MFFYICYNLILCRGRTYNIFSAGGVFFRAHKVSSKRGRILELDFDVIFVKPFHWSSISQAYTRVLHAQDFPRIMGMDVYCNVY